MADEEQPQARPSRIVALLAAVVLGPGAGHFFVGAPRRALAFVIPYWTLMVLAGLVVALWHEPLAIGLFLVPVGVHVASLIDLVRLPQGRLERPPLLAFALPTLAVVVAGVLLRNGVSRWLCEVTGDTGGTMVPTLSSGDTVVLTRLGAVGRGDLVATREGTGALAWGRVVGLAGERVTLKEGQLAVAGVEVGACALGEAELDGAAAPLALETVAGSRHLIVASPALEGEWEIGAGQLLLLPDDRRKVSAARVVPAEQVLGHATSFVSRGGGLHLAPVGEIALPRGADKLGGALAACR